MKSNISISRFVSAIVLLMIVGSFFIFHILNKQASRSSIVTNRQPSIPALQTLQSIYINSDEQSPLIAVQGKLIFMGSKSPNNPPCLIALDENTGNQVWQYGNNNETTLTASNSMVFVGEVGSVTALNANNGEVVWSKQLPLTRSVLKLLIRNNILYVDTVSGNYFLLETETGRIIQTISYAIDSAPNKDVPNWSNHKMNLEFAGSTMYFQKQTGYPDYEGEIIATDEFSGNQVWSSGSLSAVSRIVASPLGVFILGLDGKLLRFNSTKGFKEELIQFTPPPIPRYFPENEAGRDYGYYVAVDTETQLLFIYFGDSAQLFAFRLPISP